MTTKTFHFFWLRDVNIPSNIREVLQKLSISNQEYALKIHYLKDLPKDIINHYDVYIKHKNPGYNILELLYALYTLNKEGGVYINSSVLATYNFEDIKETPQFFITDSDKTIPAIISNKGNQVLDNTFHALNGINPITNTYYFTPIKLSSFLREQLEFNRSINNKFSVVDVYNKDNFLEDKYNIPLSIVLPVYNEESKVVKTVNSILDSVYTDFELIIVNDGSTDNTESEIFKLKDPRIVYIRKSHSGISETLNVGIKNSFGNFIARADAGTIIFPEKFKKQLEYFKRDPFCHILGTGAFVWNTSTDSYQGISFPIFITSKDFSNINLTTSPIIHPSIMFRREVVEGKERPYLPYYDKIEDIKFYLEALNNGFSIRNLKDPLLTLDKTATTRTSWDYSYRAIRAYRSDDRGELTCIIAFRDEGLELLRTIESIRSTVSERGVHIICVDDSVKNEYPYKKWVETSGGTYIKTSGGIGSSKAKQLGINACKSPYFILLDAHMRFYQFSWDTVVVDKLKSNSKTIYCCATSSFSNPITGVGSHEYRPRNCCEGGYIDATLGDMFTAYWATSPKVSSILGASYCSSKEWWDTLGGYNGLQFFGQEEAFISIKCILAGGHIDVIREVTIGHLFKDQGVSWFKGTRVENVLFIHNTFGGNPKELTDLMKKCSPPEIVPDIQKSYDKFMSWKDKADAYRDEFRKIQIYPMEYFWKLNKEASGQEIPPLTYKFDKK